MSIDSGKNARVVVHTVPGAQTAEAGAWVVETVGATVGAPVCAPVSEPVSAPVSAPLVTPAGRPPGDHANVHDHAAATSWWPG